MWLWWSAAAFAGDLSLYTAACRLVDEHYLWPERVDHAAMFGAAAVRAEQRVEPVMVQVAGAEARVTGKGRTVVVRFGGDLPAALNALEDAVRAVAGELPESLDVRAELIKGALSVLDRHTVLLTGDGLERFDERLSGTLTGVGVTVTLVEGHLEVADVYANSPAERANLAVGDRVLRIDGIATDGMAPADASQRLRGRSGSTVRLDVDHAGTARTLELVRAEIAIPNVTGAVGPRGVAVVRIDHFSEVTVNNLERVLATLREAGHLGTGLILDLRGNSGGSLVQSARSADTFIDTGRIVTTLGRGGERVAGLVQTVDAHRDTAALPAIVVLVDHDSASGAEILAGALRHLGRAILIGETTFGKGTVQTLWPLGEGLKLKLTVAEYTVGDGVHVHEVGITPDVALYPIDGSSGTFWYPDHERLGGRLPPDTHVLYRPAPAAGAPPSDDAADLAAAVLSAGAAPDRDGLLASVATLLPTLSTVQAARVAESLRSTNLDWSPGPASGSPAVALGALGPVASEAGQPLEMSLQLTNSGPELHQAALRLRSTNPDVDDLVVPVGHVAPNTSTVVHAVLRPALGSPARTDRLVAVLECDGCEAAQVLDTTLSVHPAPAPRVALTAHVVEDRLVLAVTNAGDQLLTGVHARALWPDEEGVEVGAADPVGHPLAPATTREFSQAVHFGSGRAALALKVELSADGYPDLASWPVEVAVAGESSSMAAPDVELTVTRPRNALAQVQIHLADTDGLDHVIVQAGPLRVDRSRWDATVQWDSKKLLVRELAGRRAHLSASVPLAPGSNRVVVIAEDRAGLRTRREVVIYSEGADPQDGVALTP